VFLHFFACGLVLPLLGSSAFLGSSPSTDEGKEGRELFQPSVKHFHQLII